MNYLVREKQCAHMDCRRYMPVSRSPEPVELSPKGDTGYCGCMGTMCASCDESAWGADAAVDIVCAFIVWAGYTGGALATLPCW